MSNASASRSDGGDEHSLCPMKRRFFDLLKKDFFSDLTVSAKCETQQEATLQLPTGRVASDTV